MRSREKRLTVVLVTCALAFGGMGTAVAQTNPTCGGNVQIGCHNCITINGHKRCT